MINKEAAIGNKMALINSTGRVVRFRHVGANVTDITFSRKNGTFLQRRSFSELCQDQMSYVVARRVQIRQRLRCRMYITPPLESRCATKKLTSSASISLLIQLLYIHVYVCTRVVVRCCLALSIIVGSGTLRTYPRESMVITVFE
jgi:hypothetical protein